MELLSWSGMVIVGLTSIGLLISHNWRYSILFFALQYTGVFLLITSYRPIEIAGVILLTGWVSGIVLGFVLLSEQSVSLSISTDTEQEAQILPSGKTFRFFTICLVLLAIWALTPNMETLAPGVGQAQFYGSAILISMGMLQVSLTTQPFRVILGLLTFLAGAEIIYDSIENSVLITGLFSVVNLCLALVGAYLLIIHSTEIKQ